MAEYNEIPRLDRKLDGNLKDSEQKITSVKEFPAGNFGGKESDRVFFTFTI